LSTIKSKALAVAAALALIGGVGTAGVLGTAVTANAATPSCGTSCVDIFSYEFGHHFTPNFVVDVFQQHIRIGQPIILFRAANDDLAEDFEATLQGTVADFYAAGMVSPAFALHYGCTGTVPVAGAQIPCIGTGGDDYAFEIEYTPNGVQSGLCVGVASTAVQGEGVTLQECGSTSKTIWAVDQADASNDSTNPVLTEYVPLINGSDTNFSQPFVLTYPQNGYPTDKPRPQLTVDNLTGYTNPGTGDPAGVDSNQLWGADFGPYVFEI
jgi:hypothetical protein